MNDSRNRALTRADGMHTTPLPGGRLCLATFTGRGPGPETQCCPRRSHPAEAASDPDTTRRRRAPRYDHACPQAHDSRIRGRDVTPEQTTTPTGVAVAPAHERVADDHIPGQLELPGIGGDHE